MVTRSVILLVLCVSTLSALPASYQDYANAIITRFESSFLPFKGYSFRYETSDGQTREETAELRPQARGPGQGQGQGRGLAGGEGEDGGAALAVTGSYSYVGDDGNNYRVQYTADQDGFRPQGEHLPPSAGVRKLGIPSAAIASLAGGGLG